MWRQLERDYARKTKNAGTKLKTFSMHLYYLCTYYGFSLLKSVDNKKSDDWHVDLPGLYTLVITFRGASYLT